MELISRAHLLWKRRIARDLLPFGISPKQIYVLRELAESGGLTPSGVADLIFADRPTATSMLNTLERAGWISRRPDPRNRRQVIVEIASRGRAKLASVPVHLWRTGKTAFDPEAALSTAERAEMTRLLEKLNAWIEKKCAAEEDNER
jgi:DNA-binding MarR family transcriptional regulator